MVSYLGKDLNITISCDHLPGHSWMSYVCWYSIRQNLPDAKVNVVCRRKNVSGYLFLWTKKVGVPFEMYNEKNLLSVISSRAKPNLVIDPLCVCVRDFEESDSDLSIFNTEETIFLEKTSLCCDAKSEDFSCFCSYEDGWGHFVTKDWINKVECPLASLTLKKFLKSSMSFNERRIGDLWNSSLTLFQTVSGGVTI